MFRGGDLGRFLLLVATLATTAGLLQARHRTERIVPRQTLNAFPTSVGLWTGKNMDISPDVLQVLGPGDFASRMYFRDGQPPLDLFIAYFASQRSGDTIHSPKNCLPGSGWTPMQSSYIQIAIPNHLPITVNRYVIGKGSDRQLVLYW